MSDGGAGRAKTRLAVLAAMPYPTVQGSQVFIGSLVYALKQAGYDITFHTYPLSDKRLSAQDDTAQGGTNTESEDSHGIPPLLHKKLAGFSGQLENQLRTMGLNTLAGHVKGQIDTLGGLGELAGLLSPQLLKSGPSVAKVEQDLVLFKDTLLKLRDQRPQLLYVHNYEALAMGLPLGMMLNIPVLYHAHNVMSEELPSYFQSFQTRFLATLGGRALDFLPALADQLLFFSQQQIDLLSGKGLADDKLNIIPPGLLAEEPPDLFWQSSKKSVHYQIPEDPFFLYTGNCDNYQNLELLLEAMDIMGNTLPHKLLLCTSSRPPLSWRKNPKIIYQPMRGNSQLTALLDKATALVVPRKAAFGFPIKVIQALRAGLPVIGLRNSLSQLLLEHEALMVEDNSHALASAMIKIGLSPSLRNRLSQQARITFAQRFSLENQLPQYDAVFKKLIAAYSSGKIVNT